MDCEGGVGGVKGKKENGMGREGGRGKGEGGRGAGTGEERRVGRLHFHKAWLSLSISGTKLGRFEAVVS